MSQSQTVKRRARSPEKKLARRMETLDVAHDLLTSKGIDLFSMEDLAKETGLARASLYRYFGSREEVLLALYQQLRHVWQEALCKKLSPEMSDGEFVKTYFKVSQKDPIRTELRSRLESTIKHNVSEAALAEELNLSQEVLMRLIGHLELCTGLSEDKCHDLVISFGALLIGASHLDSTPRIRRNRLSSRAMRTAKALSFKKLFESNGMRIITGLRNE